MKPAASLHWNPDRLDMRAFAQAGANLSVDEPLARYVRLVAEMPEDADAGQWSVQWTAQGELRAGDHGAEAAVWLHLSAQAVLPVTCQRCLTAVPLQLAVDRWFRFVANEALAAAEDDDCEEDVLSLEPRPSLRELLEDELLMALPLVPMHETCQAPLLGSAAAGEDPTDAGEPGRRHPFAELARLKK